MGVFFWFAGLQIFAFAAATSTSLQGYKKPVLQSSPEFTDKGMYVPLFAVCGTVLQPFAYDMSGDEDHLTFIDKTFGFSTRDNIYVTSNQSMRRPVSYSSAMQHSSPGCFRYKQIARGILAPSVYKPPPLASTAHFHIYQTSPCPGTKGSSRSSRLQCFDCSPPLLKNSQKANGSPALCTCCLATWFEAGVI